MDPPLFLSQGVRKVRNVSRARRAALVAALILAAVAAPGLASLTTAAPPQRTATPAQAPALGEKASLRGGERASWA